MQGVTPPPPPPNGDAWDDMPGATAPGIGEAAGAPAPGHGAGAAARGASLGHGSVWAAAWHIGSTTTAKMREKR